MRSSSSTCSNLTENSAHGTTLRNNIVPQRLIKRLISNYTLITTQHGAIKGKTQKSQFKFYSLDAIITVGYRVNSIKDTKFHQWTTLVLKKYITKGFALGDERLKQGTAVFGKEYFRELFEEERYIRASECRI